MLPSRHRPATHASFPFSRETLINVHAQTINADDHRLEASRGEWLKVADEALLLAQPQALTLASGDGAAP
ncbi:MULTISPECIES: hypothetical protein [unclassified Thioalkalivibrio]|uniref:hypothetical protein n=1 Tax=unclassified Thioalkalivibrio TaxID=2621013 RepID=UPI0003A09598|nr:MULTISPECIES: hypothetical protein [unclassified Thioalkalivibrio]